VLRMADSPLEYSFVSESRVQWSPVLCQYIVDSPVESSVVLSMSDSPVSVLRSGSVRFFAPKTRNRGPQPVQDRPRYWGDRTGPPRTGLLRSMQPKQTSSDRFLV
jgi:hypothetical protein